MSQFNESIVEDAALTWFGEPGYSCLGAEALTPNPLPRERGSYGDVVLVGWLREAIWRLDPAMPEEAWAAIRHYRKVQIPTGREAEP